LAASGNLDEALAQTVPLINESFRANAAIWLRDQGGLSLHHASALPFSEKSEIADNS